MADKTVSINLKLPRWASRSHPVFWLEMQRHARNWGLVSAQRVFLAFIFGITGLAILLVLIATLPSLSSSYYDLDSAIANLLLVALIVLLCIQLVAGAVGNVLVIAVASPLVSSEIELQSWRLLRTTTLPLRGIIFAKLAAALRQMRTLLGGLLILRLATTITGVLLFVHVMLRQTFYYMNLSEFRSFFTEGPGLPLIFPVMMVPFYFLSQPLIQAVLNGTLGLVASVYTRSRAQAVAGGLAARLIGWVLSALLNIGAIFGLISLITTWSSPSYTALGTFRVQATPTPEQVVWAVCLVIAGYLVAVLAVQIGLILSSLGVVLRRAHSLGV